MAARLSRIEVVDETSLTNGCRYPAPARSRQFEFAEATEPADAALGGDAGLSAEAGLGGVGADGGDARLGADTGLGADAWAGADADEGAETALGGEAGLGAGAFLGAEGALAADATLAADTAVRVETRVGADAAEVAEIVLTSAAGVTVDTMVTEAPVTRSCTLGRSRSAPSLPVMAPPGTIDPAVVRRSMVAAAAAAPPAMTPIPTIPVTPYAIHLLLIASPSISTGPGIGTTQSGDRVLRVSASPVKLLEEVDESFLRSRRCPRPGRAAGRREAARPSRRQRAHAPAGGWR
ncbi:hypothetical protein GCM10022382_17310 [Microbacterium invictum]